MNEFIGVFGLITSLVIGMRGLFLYYINRQNIKEILGFDFSLKILGILLFLFIVIFTIFSLLTYLNIHLDLIRVDLHYSFKTLGSEVIGFISGAFLEEFFFRALLFLSLIQLIKYNSVLVIVTSILFSTFHFPENFLHFTSYFLGGVIYGYSFIKFQNFLFPVWIHFSWNFIQGAIFGYPVSGVISEGIFSLSITPDTIFNGGDQGPEGSFSGIILRLFIVLMIYAFPYKSSKKKFLKIIEDK